MEKILLVASNSSKHLGLFNDLKSDRKVDVVYFPEKRDFRNKAILKLSPLMSWKQHVLRNSLAKTYARVVIVDTALAKMDYRTFCAVSEMAESTYLLVLNSLNASSPTFAPAIPKLQWVERDCVFTFDSIDARQYGYKYYGLEYYSKHLGFDEYAPKRDCYFVGGIKGDRGDLIRNVYKDMKKKGVNARFDCKMVTGDQREWDDCEEVNWIGLTWIPYEETLKTTLESRCIIEILQKGQHAQSLRYFEAICHNRKLLTTNKEVVKLPYYDPKYIRVFENPSDIDFKWLRSDDLPNYGYSGDFSPTKNRLLTGIGSYDFV